MDKFRISIIDFLPENGKHEVGTDKNGNPVHLGDMISYNGEDNWFVAYRYGNVLLKQVGMMAMIGLKDFGEVEKVNSIGAGNDWLIIGNKEDPKDQPLYEAIKHLIEE